MSEAPHIAGPRQTEAHWRDDATAAWLIEHGGERVGLVALLREFCERLEGEGLALYRVHMGLRSTHPEIVAQTVIWTRGTAGSRQVDHGYGMTLSSGYQNSPVRLIHEGAGGFRRRLEGPTAQFDFPVLRDMVEQGCTDYLIMPLVFASGQINFVSWSTDRPGGFRTPELSRLYDLVPLLALRVEIEMANRNAANLLTTYLGPSAARRVLAGSVRRGQVERIRAAIWVSDLRGFTRLSDRVPTRQVIAVLNDYFDVMDRAIEAHGGEILKFVGDGLLAIFNAGPTSAEDCARAMAAAREVLARIEGDNQERAAEGLPTLRTGIGLHVGEVAFGNIGAHDRLDFTVIGPAVNEAVRVEALCKVLERPLLISGAFAAAAGHAGLESVGSHALRGVSTPQELYAPIARRES
jgi:adenylate cyclase